MSNIVIYVKVIPDQHAGEDIYLVGNFNNWNTRDPHSRLHHIGGNNYKIELVLHHIDTIAFRCCRGSWKTLECSTEGRLLNVREANLAIHDNITHTVHAWRDDYPASTASPNVHLLDDEFYMPQLGRYRRIWIYLPENYHSKKDSYPVIYMHDGQDLFDEAHSEGRTGPVEWCVDETMDQTNHPSIVIGIEHDYSNDTRFKEYSYHTIKPGVLAEGKAYLEFIVKTLKPFIDNHYRTLCGKVNTSIAGGSMGALISLYGGIYYPDIFGNIAAFSPSLWADKGQLQKDLLNLPQEHIAKLKSQQYYLYAGSLERRINPDGSKINMQEDVIECSKYFTERIGLKPRLWINPEGKHGAFYWRNAFKWFYDTNHQKILHTKKYS